MAIHKINGDGFLSDISQSGHLGMNKQSPTTERGGGGGTPGFKDLLYLPTLCSQYVHNYTPHLQKVQTVSLKQCQKVEHSLHRLTL